MPTLTVIRGTRRGLRHVLADRAGDRLADPVRLLGIAIGEDDRELVAADPRQHVALAGAAVENAGDLLDHAVADRVAEGVVDLLEVVEVERHQRPGGAVAAAAGHLPAQVFLEAAPVLQPGQRVLARFPLQLAHPLVARPDQDQGAEQRRQREPEDHRSSAAGRFPAGSGRARPATRSCRRS